MLRALGMSLAKRVWPYSLRGSFATRGEMRTGIEVPETWSPRSPHKVLISQAWQKCRPTTDCLLLPMWFCIRITDISDVTVYWPMVDASYSCVKTQRNRRQSKDFSVFSKFRMFFTSGTSLLEKEFWSSRTKLKSTQTLRCSRGAEGSAVRKQSRQDCFLIDRTQLIFWHKSERHSQPCAIELQTNALTLSDSDL